MAGIITRHLRKSIPFHDILFHYFHPMYFIDWVHALLYYQTQIIFFPRPSSMIKKLQDLDIITAKDVSLALVRNDTEELALVSVTVALSDLDFDFILAICLQLCSSQDSKVHGNALSSLGYLARRFRQLDEQTIKPLIESSLRDPDEYIRVCAKSAADEIHQFLHWQIEGHIYG
jgi:hypothetical protein